MASTNFFTSEASKAYDEKNKPLAAISDNMHFLIRLILRDLPSRAHVLCAGVGTGAEILSLSKAFPEWTFLGVDPSSDMLKVCRERLEAAGVLSRCQLFCGHVEALPEGKNFDAALSVLVAHFVDRDKKLDYFRGLYDRLKSGGYLINTEISYDLDSKEFKAMLVNWAKVQSLMGATTEALSKIPDQLRNVLSVIPPSETEALLRKCGLPMPVRFFQALMICGWYGQK